MDSLWLDVRLLTLLAVANTAPLLAKRWFQSRWAAPLDGGLTFVDGRPLLGPSKTWRGVAAAIAACAALAPCLGLPLQAGMLLGAGAMAGDAISSFVKRRLGIASSGRATGIDQIPEALLPLCLLRQPLGLSVLDIVAITGLFFGLQVPLARVWHRLGWRDTPY